MGRFHSQNETSATFVKKDCCVVFSQPDSWWGSWSGCAQHWHPTDTCPILAQHKYGRKFSFPDGKVNSILGGVDLKLFDNCQQLKKEYICLVYNNISLVSYLKASFECTRTVKLSYPDTQRRFDTRHSLCQSQQLQRSNSHPWNIWVKLLKHEVIMPPSFLSIYYHPL